MPRRRCGGSSSITHGGHGHSAEAATEIQLTDAVAQTPTGVTAPELEALSEALDKLASFDAPLAQLVDLHFFCGFDFIEIAALRGVSERTVQREWRKARLLLHDVMTEDAVSE